MHNPFFAFRHLVEKASLAPTTEARAKSIVSGVKAAMRVAVCSLYVRDRRGDLCLVATDGLKEKGALNIRLKPGDGLVGTIAETQTVLNLESARSHPKFHYFPESGEDRFEAFLGAPIVHEGELVGVLVVEEESRRKFTEEEVCFLVTAAVHLGSLSPGDFKASFPTPPRQAKRKARAEALTLSGISASGGIGMGRMIFLTAEDDLMNVIAAASDNPEREVEVFRKAVASTIEEFGNQKKKFSMDLPSDLAEVFSVYEMMLSGEELPNAVENTIKTSGVTASTALRKVVTEYASRFEDLDDEYLQARGEDIRIIGGRIYSHICQSSRPEIGEDEKIILAGSLISIADLSAYSPACLAGIVCAEGSVYSHTSLLARALGVPAVTGIGRFPESAGKNVAIIDGYRGEVHLAPSEKTLREYEKLIAHEEEEIAEMATLKDEPAITPDGHRVYLMVNTGLLSDITPGLANGAEGVGLHRSEIPFLIHDWFPSEEEQTEFYRSVLEAYHGMPVYIRTLDVGGDKPLPYFPFEEENPALGWRGVRFSLDNSPVFLTQIRAMLRASTGLDNLYIMLPMVNCLSEVESFRHLLNRAIEQLAEEGIEVSRPSIGIMAEIPVIVSLLSHLKGLIDFVSIGSNDLSQYALAVDRNDPRVAPLFDHLHPGVIRLVADIVENARKNDMDVSVCGDLAADPLGVILLLGMEIKALSMPAFSIPKMKRIIRSVPLSEARHQLQLALASPDARTTRDRLKACIEQQSAL